MENSYRSDPETDVDPPQIIADTPFDDFVKKYGTIQRRGIFGHLVHHMGRSIVGGDYPAGSFVPNEPELVARFGISRTVVREAMKCLAGKGLVEIKTRTGTRVRDRSDWHHTDTDVMVWYYEAGPSAELMASIKDLRRVLEPEAAARAASRGTPEEVARISNAFEAMLSAGQNMPAIVDADLEFHTAIFAATHNMVFAQLIDLIAVGIYANRTILSPDQLFEAQQKGLPLHRDVLEAIVARDPVAATAATQRMLDAWRIEQLARQAAQAPAR